MDFSILIRIQEFIDALTMLQNRLPVSLCTAFVHVQFMYDDVYIMEYLISSNDEVWVGQTCGHGSTRYKNYRTFRSKPDANRAILHGIKHT